MSKAIGRPAAPPRAAPPAPLQPRALPAHLARAVARPALPAVQAKKTAAPHVAQAIARPAARPPAPQPARPAPQRARPAATQPARPPTHLAAALRRPAAPPAARTPLPAAPSVQRRAAPARAVAIPPAAIPPAARPVIQCLKWRYNGKTWEAADEETRGVEAPSHLFGFYIGQIYEVKPQRLMFGEGNFTFSRSYLGTNHPEFVSSTTVSDFQRVQDTSTGNNVDFLTRLGAPPEFGVDARSESRPREVDHFNFPHPGGLSETSGLIGDYFGHLSRTQEMGHIVRMGLEEKPDSDLPNQRYGLIKHMKNSHYRPVRKMRFDDTRFPGYSHTKTNAHNGKVTFKGRRVEVWFRNEGKSGDRTRDLRDLPFTDGEDSEEEREQVMVRRNRRFRANAERRQTRPRLERTIHLKRDRPEIEIQGSFTFTTSTADVYRTVLGSFTVRPTGGLLRASLLEVVFEQSTVDGLYGERVWVKTKHLDHLFATEAAREL